MARGDWTDSLDWERAVRHVRSDAGGDWHRDPWGWPEYEFALSTGRPGLIARTKGTDVKRVSNIDVPKSNFLTRPAVVLEPVDRLIYQATVDRIAKKMLFSMPDWAYGWRTPRASDNVDAKYTYCLQSKEWESFRKHLQACVSVFGVGLKSDITSCFASIPVTRLSEEVERLGGNNQVTEKVHTMLVRYDAMPDRRGLSQRSLASCVLANSYLSGLDSVLKDFTVPRRSLVARLMGDYHITVRWMDDIWAFSFDESKLRRLQFDLEGAARELGLELNSSKTRVLSGDELAQEALAIEHSAVDEALDDENPDTEPLEELLDRILEAPLSADRTTIRFATTRMRRHRVDSRTLRLIEVAEKMPQGADHLARVFRDFGVWPELQDWYLDYEKSNWARNRWSVAQFGTMFPTKSKDIDPKLVERFAELLLERSSLPLTALTAQRLVSWSPPLAAECIRQLTDVTDHPAERRVIGLAAVALRENRTLIRRILGAYEENKYLLDLVEERGFRPFDVVPDFAADPLASTGDD